MTDDEELEREGGELDSSVIEINGTELYEHFRFVADKGQELLRVDKFLVLRLQKSSRNRIQQAAEAGCILVNGKPVKSNYRVKPLDVVQVVMDRPRYEFEIVAQDIPLDIVYEDRYVLVVNKPAGMVVHPGHGNYDGTLVNALAWHFRNTPDYDVNDPRLGLVHRIDKDTSGLLVVAKTPDAKTDLGRQFFNKTTKREYVALVWGTPEPPEGTVATNIGRSPKDRLQMTTFPLDGPEGKRAVTHYSVIEPMAHVSLVKCVLETGRTHQIRVHMAHTGCPLLGDPFYGSRACKSFPPDSLSPHRDDTPGENMALPPIKRTALHAESIHFLQPFTGEELLIEAPLPDDMRLYLSEQVGEEVNAI